MQINLRHIVALVSVSLSAGLAHATDASTCAAELGLVKDAIYAATFYDPKADTNRSNMIAKVDAAAAKLALNKPADAIDKLQAVSDQATTLATAAKPKLDDATGINMAASDAITCVGLAP